MSETANFKVGRAAESIESSPALDGISAVTVYTDEDSEGVKVGSASGRNLDATSPWITRQIGADILARLKGFQYQPYTAQDALLDPSAEIGDAITLDKIYSGIYATEINFNALMRTTASAPADEDIDEEVPYKSPERRRVARKLKDVSSQLLIMADRISAEVTARESDTKTLTAALAVQADQISAKVSRIGGSASSFGWKLLADSWTLSSNGGTVLKADKNGLKVTGEIEATSGKIGGFVLKNGYLSTNNQTWGGTNTNGIYIGSSGIQLGKNFKVDSGGNLTAYSGTFGGTVRCDALYLRNSYGGYTNVAPSDVISGVNGGNSWAENGRAVTSNAANGAYAYGTLSGASRPSISLNASGTLRLSSGTFEMNGKNVFLGSLWIDGTEYHVLRWI